MTTELNQKTLVNQVSNFNKSIYQELKIEVFERRIFLKLPKNEKTSLLFGVLLIQNGIQPGFIRLYQTIQET